METVYVHRQSGDHSLSMSVVKQRHRAEISFPDVPLSAEQLTGLGYEPQTILPRPAFDSETQFLEPGPVVEASPGLWEQGWVIVALPQADLDARADARAQAQLYTQADAAIAADNVVAQLKTMTVAEFDAWWAANVTTAAQAIAILKRLARVVIRRVL